uniref:C2orf72-like C-terminal domain-containing protein n=1 Tax=Gopherus evgoodei TaxID=1825980 RepID=A0A8C4WB14_9SAUR
MEEPRQRSLKLEFVTLQFMMGGNVHLVGELLSQHTVEEFQQEVFARFPIPAFRVTSTVACNQATSRRAERGLSLHELGCSGQKDRIYSQLIFFLCRASSLIGWVGLDRLLEMLQQLKHCIYYIPVALVGVIVQENPELDLEQEVKALRWLKCLLDGVFCCDLLPGHEGTEQEVQVQVATYQSGQPQRALEVKRAACQAIRVALNWVQEAWEQNGDGRIEIWHSGFGEVAHSYNTQELELGEKDMGAEYGQVRKSTWELGSGQRCCTWTRQALLEMEHECL